MLDTLLSTFDVTVEPFAVCEVHSGWRLNLEAAGTVGVHYVLAGTGTLRTDGGPMHSFGPGAIVIVPHGVAQTIATPGARHSQFVDASECRPPAEGLERLRIGAGAPGIVMACGRVRAGYGPRTGIFDLLKEPIVETFAAGHPARRAMESLLYEASAPRLGSRALSEALMKQCLILTLRRLAERGDPRLPWLCVLHHRRLAAAFEVMMARPHERLDVEALAAHAGMSRSAFAEHFVRAFGRAPHEFLTEQRLHRAAHYLKTTDLPVKAIADKIGYRSRSHFSRAFKALYGIGPDAYRRSTGDTGCGAPDRPDRRQRSS